MPDASFIPFANIIDSDTYNVYETNAKLKIYHKIDSHEISF